MSEQSNDIQWYIARDGKQHGPLTEIEMRTFVAHNYLRATDLIWRPGLPEWQASTELFPAAFQSQPAAAQPAAPAQPTPQSYSPQPKPFSQPAPQRSLTFPAAPTVDEHAPIEAAAEPSRGVRKRLAIAAAAVAVIGGGAFALANYADPLLHIVQGGPEQTVEVVTAPPASGEAPSAAPQSAETPAATEPPASASEPSAAAAAPPASEAPAAPLAEPFQTAAADPTQPATTATDAAPAAAPATPDTQTAVLAPTATAPAAPPNIDGSAIDARLRKIPAWTLIKKDYPDWYVGHIAAAERLAAEQKPESEIAMHLSQGLVNLRRQNAEKALAASPEKLRKIATAFLDNLKALRAQSVSACYGFISKGEVSPAVVQMMQSPETATAFHAQISAVFEAIAEGSAAPVKHDPAVKADYDILIKELGKLGWKEEDLQVFSNPRLLAKREPDRVCKMVQEWFVAHLAVPDQPARDRLLYETLKPVVSG